MNFTSDWVTHNHDRWVQVLGHLRPLQAATMAELGSYEGRSALWFLEHVLWGPESTMVCIDPWTGILPDIEHRFDENTAAARDARRLKKMKGDRWTLATFPAEHFDAIYIDGDHQAHAVLRDAVVAWRALKVGGVLIFDDYGKGFNPSIGPRELIWMWSEVQLGVESFSRAMGERAQPLFIDYQAIFRKVGD